MNRFVIFHHFCIFHFALRHHPTRSTNPYHTGRSFPIPAVHSAYPLSRTTCQIPLSSNRLGVVHPLLLRLNLMKRTQAAHKSAASQPSHDRLQKVLAGAGYGSRRSCEELIVAGRVEVDREVVSELGTRVDIKTQDIRVDGESLVRPKLVYYLVNKPAGIVCTNRDPGGRTRVIDLVPGGDRLFTVGRLDRSSEGLIIVTNDGDLSHRLAHPKYGIEKTYLVEVAGRLTQQDLGRLRRGVHLAEAFAKAVRVHVKKALKHTTQLEIVLREGRNREIRRMLARVGHKVLRLRRIAFGSLKLGNLPVGAMRPLSRQEVAGLTNPPETRAAKSPRRPKDRQRGSQGDSHTKAKQSGSRRVGKILGPGSS